MDKPLDLNEIKKVEESLKNSVEEDRKYWLINSVKCDAVHTAKTYEEFSDRVAAAHLRPLDKADQVKAGSCRTLWNRYAQKDNKKNE